MTVSFFDMALFLEYDADTCGRLFPR